MTDKPEGKFDVAARLFEAVLRLAPRERPGFLDHECAGDAALRKLVEDLVRSHDRQGAFLSEPAVIPKAAERAALGAPSSICSSTPILEGEGTRIGPYKLLQQLGEGGFGVVFMAEQERPVRRRVALKIIKLGMDTRQVVARFEQEREALALMDHPNIARVLDAGSTETGRPYFVMELVRGVSITQYCDANHLTPKERLELFIPVCLAIQHAHQKGIIHRDIKPSNVLVTLHDGKPVPKIIDFGIAKATDRRLTEKTLFTELNSMIGTPVYMSPEQAEMSGLDIDTRSDVYSLGILLYELLTGTTPFSKDELNAAGYAGMQQMIRNVDPPKPSTRISTLGERLSCVALQRRTEPKRLGGMLRGDLDWVVMRSIEKDRSRRYDTATGLADDVQRYLQGEPVRAAPPSAGYRMRKFVRRNKSSMAVAVAFVLSVLFSLGALVAALHIARRDRDIAEYDATVASEQLMSAQVELATVQTNLKREARQLDAVLRATTEAMSDLQITEAVAATVAAEYKDAYEKTASAGSPQSPADHAHILDKLARMSKGAEDGVRKIHAAQFRLHQLAGRDIVEWIPDGRNPIYPNIHAAAREGIWNPDPGYAWCDDIGMQVMWRPGLRHTNDPEKMAGPVEGTWVSIPNRVKGI